MAQGDVVALIDELGGQAFDQGIADRREQILDAQGEALEHELVAVAVHDQARKEVGLPEQETEGLGIRQDALAVNQGLADAPGEECPVDLLLLAGEEANRNQGMGVIIPNAKEALAGVAQLDQAPGRGIALEPGDLIGERPEVAVLDAAVLLGLEDDLGKADVGLFLQFTLSW